MKFFIVSSYIFAISARSSPLSVPEQDYAEETSGLKIARLAMTAGMELLDIIEKAEAHVAHAQ